MRKLSQRELLEDGFGSMLSGLARGARNAIGSVATAVAPETMGALGKGASLAAGAVERIRSGSPRASAGTFLDSEDGKREFKDIKLGKETKLENQNFKIEVKSGYYLNSVGGDQIEEKDISGGYIILRRKKRGGAGGFDNEIIEVWDSKNKRLNDKPIKAGVDDAADRDSEPGTDDKEKQITLKKLEALGYGYPIKIGSIDYHYETHNTKSVTTFDESGRRKIHPIEGLEFEVYPNYNKANKKRDLPATAKPKPTKTKTVSKPKQPVSKPTQKKTATSSKSPNKPAKENRFNLSKSSTKKQAAAKTTVSKPTLSTLNAALADIKKPEAEQDKEAKNKIKAYLNSSGKAKKIKSDPKHRPSIVGRRVTPLQAKKLLEKKKSQKNILRQFSRKRFR
tara:strand:- start:1240 stop:2421 length:1182 start_codon:yes stop_codon:yes gene_type:complete